MKKLCKAMVLILAFALILSLAGCTGKKPITVDEFEDIMEDEGLNVIEWSSDDLANGDDYDIDEVRYANGDDFYPFVIFTDFGSEDDAKDFFKNDVDISMDVLKNADSDAKITTQSSEDYEYFTVKGEARDGLDVYSVNIRIKNTIILVYSNSVSKSDVKEVDAIVKKLGY